MLNLANYTEIKLMNEEGIANDCLQLSEIDPIFATTFS